LYFVVVVVVETDDDEGGDDALFVDPLNHGVVFMNVLEL
jgi:hypothetical protein